MMRGPSPGTATSSTRDVCLPGASVVTDSSNSWAGARKRSVVAEGCSGATRTGGSAENSVISTSWAESTYLPVRPARTTLSEEAMTSIPKPDW